MHNEIFTTSCDALPFDKAEILRYAGMRESNESVESLLEECLQECEGIFARRVCYRVFSAEEVLARFGKESKALEKNLEGCEYTLLFAATAGLGIDRLIAKYANISVAKALIFQAIGAERIEDLCDGFCGKLKAEAGAKGWRMRPRFSPGYGDLPLEAQKEIFGALDCARKIGLSLTDSLLMMPTKSVTAIVGFYR